MPELPEVETFARDLQAACGGRRITDLWISRPGYCRPDAASLLALEGARVVRVVRRAKTVIIETDRGLALALVPRMSGAPLLAAPTDPARPSDPHAHLGWAMSERGRIRARVAWRDPRRFGNASLWRLEGAREAAPDTPGRYRRPDDGVDPFAHVGFEPLSKGFGRQRFARELRRGRKRALKAVLLDQGIVCGVGNIYADEACHRAGLDPRSPVDQLSDEQLARVAGEALAVMREAIGRRGSRVNSYLAPGGASGMADRLRAYGRAGSPCFSCGNEMRGGVVAGRGTSWCAICQPPCPARPLTGRL